MPNKPAVLRVIVLDHHKTAFDMLTATAPQYPNLDLQLDMNRSGATIALDHFRPEVLVLTMMLCQQLSLLHSMKYCACVTSYRLASTVQQSTLQRLALQQTSLLLKVVL